MKKKGFYQYQSVIPKKNSRDATIEMLDIIKSSGEGSFLAVLKTFDNKKSLGLLSFPMEGTTLALDFPNKGPNTLKLFQKLDEVVMKSGGRIYMAKDNRMSREMFEAGYPNYEKFKEYIKKQNTNTKNNILKSYDFFLNEKYNVVLNQKTIERVKNFFQ